MQSSEQEQAFLDEVYRKARLLEYDKREAAKVLRNRRVLARQRAVKLSGILIVTAVVALMVHLGEINQGMCLLLSFLLIGAGIVVEIMELSWNMDREQ